MIIQFVMCHNITEESEDTEVPNQEMPSEIPTEIPKAGDGKI